jgi:hypothetical protein
VYGTTRTEASAKGLEEEEIIPIICDAGTEEGTKIWTPIVSQADIGRLAI